MFLLTELTGFNAAAGSTQTPVAVSYVGTTADTSDSSTYTFTSHAIGTATADRVVLVAVGVRSATAGVSISSMTIGGVSATELAEASTGSNVSVAVYGLLVTSGTTATIVVTPSASCQRCQIAVYEMTGTGGSTTTSATATDITSPTSTTITIPVNGAAVAGAFGQSASAVGTATWAGLTKDADEDLENTNNRFTSARLNSASGAVGLSIGVTWSGGTPSAADALCAVAFAPV